MLTTGKICCNQQKAWKITSPEKVLPWWWCRCNMSSTPPCFFCSPSHRSLGWNAQAFRRGGLTFVASVGFPAWFLWIQGLIIPLIVQHLARTCSLLLCTICRFYHRAKLAHMAPLKTNSTLHEQDEAKGAPRKSLIFVGRREAKPGGIKEVSTNSYPSLLDTIIQGA